MGNGPRFVFQTVVRSPLNYLCTCLRSQLSVYIDTRVGLFLDTLGGFCLSVCLSLQQWQAVLVPIAAFWEDLKPCSDNSLTSFSAMLGLCRGPVHFQIRLGIRLSAFRISLPFGVNFRIAFLPAPRPPKKPPLGLH